jgi:hypothetical protein
MAYVGTHGGRVTAITTQSGFGGSISGLITTIANVGASDYNSLQIKMNMSNWHGLSFLSGYTWGKATNNSPGPFPGPNGNNQTTPTDPGGLAPGLADYDINHRFTWAGTYDVHIYNGDSEAARKFLEGWQFNSIITLQKGTPFSVFGGCCRAKEVGDPNAVDRNSDHWFNTAAFVQANSPAEQSGRNILRAPGIANVDFSIFRKFNFTERTGFEFRTEFFNLFNHPQLSFPHQFVGDGNFGRIDQTRLGSERQIQFGLRFFF